MDRRHPSTEGIFHLILELDEVDVQAVYGVVVVRLDARQLYDGCFEVIYEGFELSEPHLVCGACSLKVLRPHCGSCIIGIGFAIDASVT